MSRQTLGVAVVDFGWMGTRAPAPTAASGSTIPSSRWPRSSSWSPTRNPIGSVTASIATASPAAPTAGEDVLTNDRVQAVSVTAPNFLHREIGEAVARAGKHLWIEKPVGVLAADAEAVAAARVQSAVGFNYRNVPAVQHARTVIEQGAIGTVTNACFRLLTDYATHPHGALTWRFQREQGGSGVLGDLVSHGVDLAWLLLGEIHSLVADTAIFIGERPKPTGAASHFALAEGGEVGQVENEDYLNCLLRFTSGARGSLESSRISVGDQCNYGFEIHSTKGALYWDFRRMGELGVSLGEDYLDQTVQTALVGPGQGETGAFQPGSDIALGYEDLKVIEAARFLRSIADGKPCCATVDDAVRSARALDRSYGCLDAGFPA